jgi:hypothetical protein
VVFQAAVDGALSVHGCASVHAVVELRKGVRDLHHLTGHYLTGVLILVVWLYATLVLVGRRSGYVILLLLSILGSIVPVIHMRGAGLVGGRIANSTGKFFWVWTLIALGVSAMFSVVLSARELWKLRRSDR